ncbi:MAG: response regulator [bacterium]|nr:response regulator [bacterium]
MNNLKDILILMVDDTPLNLLILDKILSEHKYHTASVHSGEEVLQFLQKKRPSIILLDIMMPGMDGVETCKLLKKNASYRDIPIIFITALTDTEDKLRAFEAGGDDYITRPFLGEEVLARVNVVAQRLRTEDKLKTALLEKEIMLKEIHHRVKNNMQIISSLLNLQASQTTDATNRQLFMECNSRIRSMSIVHEKLYQSQNLAEINFKEFIDEMIVELSRMYYATTEKISMSVNCEDIHLDINRAIPCALLLNELVSNAMKYAFPDKRPGEIQILFRKIEKKFVMEVADNGIGMLSDLDLNNTSTLGMQLVNALSTQLEANIQLDNSNGVHFTIAFKMEPD